MHILRVAELPQALSANTVYLIKNQDDLDIVVTGEAAGIVAESKSSEKALASDLEALELVVSGKLNASQKGVAGGVASLDGDGKVPSNQLPSFVDDVLEFATQEQFPATGESGKIYVALDTNKTYRWSGSAYIYITSGAVDSVAGKTGVVELTKADVGLGNVDNTADSAKNVASAAKLTTARTIGGVSFDGTDNIDLPGVNTAGNQNTSGNAATATKLATARELTVGNASKDFDGSSDLTWTLSEIGAAEKSHTHNASDINAGTLADARLPTSMSGKILNSGELQFMNQKLHDNGASYSLNLANGNYQRFAPTANGTISFSGFTSGKLGILLVKGVGLGSRTITWPTAVNWMKTDGTFTTVFAQTGIVLQTGSDVDFIQFWSDDGGATIYAKVFR